MAKVMITSADSSMYSSPAVVVVDCNTIEAAKELVVQINDTKFSMSGGAKTIYRKAEILDV